jgi:hypothetical protein
MEDLEDQELPSPLSECKGYYNTPELEAKKESNPWHTSVFVTAEVLEKILAAPLRDYNSLVADGYDNKLSIYSLAASRSGQAWLDKWTNKYKNDHFACDVVEGIPCCSYCSY